MMKNLNRKNSISQNQTEKNGETQTRKRINSKNDVYAKITDTIIENLEKGFIPWENPVINNCRPQNLVTGHIYRGINPIILSGAKTPYFMTFKQAKQIGAKIKKGAKSSPVVYWNTTVKTVENTDTGEEEEQMLYFLKYFNVFNIADIENIPEKYLEKTKIDKTNIVEIKTAEEIINNYKNAPKFVYAMGTPCYSPDFDVIRTPEKEYFKSANHYYSTLFHEMGHSTGHKSRLNRFDSEYTSLRFGSKDYAKEELTAELTATFLMAETGEKINIENRTAYIQSWLRKLQNDKKMIIYAAAKAEKAVNHILNKNSSNAINKAA